MPNLKELLRFNSNASDHFEKCLPFNILALLDCWRVAWCQNPVRAWSNEGKVAF